MLPSALSDLASVVGGTARGKSGDLWIGNR